MNEKITYTIADAGEIDEIFTMYQSAIQTMCKAGIEQWDEYYPDAKYCIIHRLCVNPEFQNRGLAAQAIQHIETECRKNGFDEIRLDSYSKNPYAIRLYDTLGYAVVGHADWRKGRFDLREKKL